MSKAMNVLFYNDVYVCDFQIQIKEKFRFLPKIDKINFGF